MNNLFPAVRWWLLFIIYWMCCAAEQQVKMDDDLRSNSRFYLFFFCSSLPAYQVYSLAGFLPSFSLERRWCLVVRVTYMSSLLGALKLITYSRQVLVHCYFFLFYSHLIF